MSEIKRISIVIPVYNEKDTLRTILERVRSAPFARKDVELEREIILVDDCSRDGTRDILAVLGLSWADLFPSTSRSRTRSWR